MRAYLLIFILFQISVVAQAQSPMEKLDAATQYIDGLSLPGKSGKEALETLKSEGFKVCRYVGGALTSLPPDEPVLLCRRHEESQFNCTKVFQVYVQMDWGEQQLSVADMLKQMQSAPVKKVTTLCL